MGAGSAAPDVAPTPALPRKRGRETSASWDERMSAERRSGHGDAAGRQHASAPSPACGGRLGWGQDQPRRTSPPPRPSPASGGGRAAAPWRERPPTALPRERREGTSASGGRGGDGSGVTKRTRGTRRGAGRDRKSVVQGKGGRRRGRGQRRDDE